MPAAESNLPARIRAALSRELMTLGDVVADMWRTMRMRGPCLLIFLLAGCASASSGLSQLRPAMSKADVIEACGVPDSTSMRDGEETLVYAYLRGDDMTVKLRSGLVTEYGPSSGFREPLDPNTKRIDVTVRRSWPW